ncbi:Actin-like ATPase [Glarea lozoyensis ATCC 20868]|uniref:Actin-like ATPase n=1 Tax=Glarea lozoyensis (strain ATCC 20868 / MF5171) TaxID=1116229 RepID=S3DIB2_GLAL2|nr:Actin-like ATPase [Glarea lozoyensis ATCC 20868]EPE26278.1 Actin-like ATPase [Glarea lozoyensis ATCC 20868]
MRAACRFANRLPYPRPSSRRHLLTLAIETSCDDTSVALLEKHQNGSATLHFDSKITSDNRIYGGVAPIVAHESHQKNIAVLVEKALLSLPVAHKQDASPGGYDWSRTVALGNGSLTTFRRKPAFVTVTRGPGMRASLITGIDTAKGLAVGWQVPLLGVNHMQAHALTPRLVAALNHPQEEMITKTLDPPFPFLTFLVSGGHTILVHSKGLCDHEILAETNDLAIGDMLDKTARDILPEAILKSAPDVMYARSLEAFAFPEEGTSQYERFEKERRKSSKPLYGWTVNTPYAKLGPRIAATYKHEFSFSGIGSCVKGIAQARTDMDTPERQHLAREAMRVTFEHLSSRVVLALKGGSLQGINTLVVSGGVASNKYLKHVLRTALDKDGYHEISLNFPPPKYCTDNAAMIAWTGMEMFEAGWRTELSAMAIRKWSVDPNSTEGGILGLDGWLNVKS